jgi:hypothetical protein
MTRNNEMLIFLILGFTLFSIGLWIWGRFKAKTAAETSKAQAKTQRVTEQEGI